MITQDASIARFLYKQRNLYLLFSFVCTAAESDSLAAVPTCESACHCANHSDIPNQRRSSFPVNHQWEPIWPLPGLDKPDGGSLVAGIPEESRDCMPDEIIQGMVPSSSTWRFSANPRMTPSAFTSEYFLIILYFYSLAKTRTIKKKNEKLEKLFIWAVS